MKENATAPAAAGPPPPAPEPPSPTSDGEEKMTLEAWAGEAGVAPALMFHLAHLNGFTPSSKGTAKQFAALLDATLKARI